MIQRAQKNTSAIYKLFGNIETNLLVKKIQSYSKHECGCLTPFLALNWKPFDSRYHRTFILKEHPGKQ